MTRSASVRLRAGQQGASVTGHPRCRVADPSRLRRGVRLLFIEKWHPMIPMIQLLGIGLLIVGPAYPMTAMITAAGRFRDNFMMYVYNTIGFFLVLIPATWIGGATGTAAGVSLWCWLAVVSIAVSAYRSWTGAITLIKSIGPAVVAAVAASVPVLLLERLVPATCAGDLLCLLIAPAILSTGYYLVLRNIDARALDELTRELGGALRGVTSPIHSLRPDDVIAASGGMSDTPAFRL